MNRITEARHTGAAIEIGVLDIHDAHVDLWTFMSETGVRHKSEWPMWRYVSPDLFEARANECFACELAYRLSNGRDKCDFCPIMEFRECGDENMPGRCIANDETPTTFDRWLAASTERDRCKAARHMLELAWDDPGDYIPIRFLRGALSNMPFAVREFRRSDLEALHRDMWNWLAETGSADKCDYPLGFYPFDAAIMRRCFACEEATIRNGGKGTDRCLKCPITVFRNDSTAHTYGCEHKGSLYYQWKTSSELKRRKLASAISALDWTDIPKEQPKPEPKTVTPLVIMSGRYYMTRDGHKAYVYTTGGVKKGMNEPIHGAVKFDEGWVAQTWRTDGKYFQSSECCIDLVSLCPDQPERFVVAKAECHRQDNIIYFSGDVVRNGKLSSWERMEGLKGKLTFTPEG